MSGSAADGGWVGAGQGVVGDMAGVLSQATSGRAASAAHAQRDGRLGAGPVGAAECIGGRMLAPLRGGDPRRQPVEAVRRLAGGGCWWPGSCSMVALVFWSNVMLGCVVLGGRGAGWCGGAGPRGGVGFASWCRGRPAEGGGWAVRRPACPGFAWAGLRVVRLSKVNGVSLDRSPVGCHNPNPAVRVEGVLTWDCDSV